MDIGKKIKALRMGKGVTQEQLAQQMNVSCQAVSKWENSTTAPDIQLLPHLSIYFGVTIDELFEITDESHMERIENLIWNERIIGDDEFKYEANYLKDKITSGNSRAQCLTLLAELYNHRAKSCHMIAEGYAKEALKLEPKVKDSHCALNEAAGGVICDWNFSNHHELIDFYKEFVKDNPAYRSGYLYLMDDLIADGRTEEARKVLKDMDKAEPGYLSLLYEGLINQRECHLDKALECWKNMLDKYPDLWLSNSTYADCMAGLCRYDEAVEHYSKAFELQKQQNSPRYTDCLEAIAHIEEIRGNYNKAIEAYENMIKLLQDEWHVTVGESLDEPRRQIERLKKLL